MVVRADLHGAVAGVHGLDRDGAPARVQHDVARGRNQGAGLQRVGVRSLDGPDRLVHGHELGAVREDAFDLQDLHHAGDARHDVVLGEDLRTGTHQLGDRPAVAGAFEDLVGDQRHGLRMVELEAAGAPLAGQFGGREDRQALEFGRRQQHRALVNSRTGAFRRGLGGPTPRRARASCSTAPCRLRRRTGYRRVSR